MKKLLGGRKYENECNMHAGIELEGWKTSMESNTFSV
jgi:hypothetical protein